MRRTLVSLLAMSAALLFPAGALAAPVLVLGHHGRVTERQDRFLTPEPLAPAQGPVTAPAGAPRSPHAVRDALSPRGATPRGATHKKKKKKPPVTVGRVLSGLVAAGRISAARRHQVLHAFNAALAAEKRLSGTRRAELADVTSTVHDIAAGGELWPSRLPAVLATLNANRRWWTSGSLLSYGQRVMFQGSLLEWEYYPGQGIQLQVLGTFGEANGFYEAGEDAQLEQVLSEMIPLASRRAGGLTWEYYFTFDGGDPPWTSAMSQATGLQALSSAYAVTKNPYYLQIAARALPVLTRRPPAGVTVPTAHGVRFLQYTFEPGTSIINAFLQTLIGLDAYAATSGDATAQRLFAEGDAEAQWEVPRFDTGAWSLYQPGEEDDLGYHELVTGFLAKLCAITSAPAYCSTAQAFTADLRTPPVITDLTHRAPADKPFTVRFRLSKISHVGITVSRGDRGVFATSATFAHGVHRVSVGKLPAGSYTVTLTGTDLAGNYAREAPAPLTLSRRAPAAQARVGRG